MDLIFYLHKTQPEFVFLQSRTKTKTHPDEFTESILPVRECLHIQSLVWKRAERWTPPAEDHTHSRITSMEKKHGQREGPAADQHVHLQMDTL